MTRKIAFASCFLFLAFLLVGFQYNISNGNPFIAPNGSTTAPGIAWASNPGLGFAYYTGGGTTLTGQLLGFDSTGTNNKWELAFNAGFIVTSDLCYTWANNTTSVSGQDTYLCRDGSGVVALKNGTNSQELRVYSTTTGSHYLSVKPGSIGPAVAGDALNITTNGGTVRTGTASNTDSAILLTYSAATTASYTFAGAYTNAPICTITPVNPGATTFTLTTMSNTTLTVTASAAFTGSVNVTCIPRN